LSTSTADISPVISGPIDYDTTVSVNDEAHIKTNTYVCSEGGLPCDILGLFCILLDFFGNGAVQRSTLGLGCGSLKFGLPGANK